MLRFYFSLTLGVFLLQVSCKASTEPQFKNPREYTWTATQLQYPGAYNLRMYSIWGSSAQNVYASGFSILGGQKGAIFRYDGRQWNPVTAFPSPDYNDLWEITGFGENDIWIAGSRLFAPTGDSAAVLHYDGARWTQVLPSHMGVRGLKSIGGTSSRSLYVGSRDGRVLRYNGVSWSVDTLYLGLSLVDIEGDDTQAFAVGNTWRGALDDSIMCFRKSLNTWQLIDIQIETNYSSSPRFGSNGLYSPQAGIFYSCGYLGVFRWEANKWVKVFSPIASLIGIEGNSPTNILTVGWRDGPVAYHWDGVSWEDLKLPHGLIPQDVALYDVWTNGKEAFIVGNNGAVSYLLHGK
jgi:hypothetical protein